MRSIWREAEVNPLGPVQLHDPLDTGCGPRSTAVMVELTVALDSPVQEVPPFTEMYGVIAVGVQVVVADTVSEIVVDAVMVPEVPVIVTVEVPATAVLLAVSVSTLVEVAGLVANAAVTPLGRPEVARVTEPVNPPTSVTVMVSMALAPWVTDSADAEGARVKLDVPDRRPYTTTCSESVPTYTLPLAMVGAQNFA
jgi:hypothetical protein